MDGCLVRLQIFNRSMKLFAYELHYHDPSAQQTGSNTSDAIINNLLDMGINHVTGGKRAFVTFSEESLLRGAPTLIPNRILVVSIPASVVPSESLFAALTELRGKGYTIALDDFSLDEAHLPLLPYAEIVKVDFTNTPLNQVESFSALMQGKPVKLLAKNLNNPEDYDTAREMGFSLFQGHFFSKPTAVERDRVELPPIKVNCIRLLKLVFEPSVNFTLIQDVIKHDLALSYRLLRVVNSAFFGLRYTVKNIRQALAILGMDEVRKWVSLISLSELSDSKPDELVRLSLTRAKLMEILAIPSGMLRDADDLFMLGLMSLMDAVMDMSYDEIIRLTSISPTIAEPLLTLEGKYGRLLKLVIAYEHGDFDTAFALAVELGIPTDKLGDAYLLAARWADQL